MKFNLIYKKIFYIALLIIILTYFIGHLIYINTPWVNTEHVFVEASKYFINIDYQFGIEYYFQWQANPVTHSYIISVFLSIFSISFWASRIPSIIGGFLVLLSGIIYYLKSNKDDNNNKWIILWISFVMTNPLFWIYSGQASNDILPVGLITVSLLICYLAEGRMFVHIIAGIIFGIAIINKYHAAILGLGYLYIIYSESNGKIIWNKKNYINSLFYIVIPLIIIVIYLYLLKRYFNIWIVPEHFKRFHGLVLNDSLANLVSYLSYFSIMMGFLGILIGIYYIKKYQSKRIVILTSIATIFLLGYILWSFFYSFHGGEMDFGAYFDTILGKSLSTLIKTSFFLLSIIIVIFLIHKSIQEKNSFGLFVLYFILPFIIILSLSRPAQRYLLFIFPIISYFIIFYLGKRIPQWTKLIGWTNVIIFTALTFAGVNFQSSQAIAEENMAQWVKTKGILKETQTGKGYYHAIHHFLPYRKDIKKYMISTEGNPPKNYLHKEKVFVFGKLIRTYYLYRLNISHK